MRNSPVMTPRSASRKFCRSSGVRRLAVGLTALASLGAAAPVAAAQSTPTITTQATATATLGSPISDTATLTVAAGGPAPTGTITFSLYGPNNPTCTGTPIFVSANRPVSGNVAVSNSFTPTTAGTYNWVAAYSGDANYAPVTAPCGAPNETSTVTASTGVTFRSLGARAVADGVRVRWRTGAETGVLGFNVYRSASGKRTRLNRRLIVAAGTRSGRAYSLLDRKAPRMGAASYWIEVVNLDGSRRWHGPARVARRI